MSYEILRQLHSYGNVKLYEVQSEFAKDLCVAKVFKPDFVVDHSLFVEQKEEFITAAKLQQQISSPYWARIFTVIEADDAPAYLCEKYDRSLRDIIDANIDIHSDVLLDILTAIHQALVDLKRKYSRPCGNLKASNVLVKIGSKSVFSKIALTDMLASCSSDKHHWAVDLREIGKIIYEAVLHRAAPQFDSIKLTDCAEWECLGKYAPQWMGLCEKLLQATSPLSDYSLEEFGSDLAGIKRISSNNHKGYYVLAVCLLVFIGIFVYTVFKPDSQADPNKWKCIVAENYVWLSELVDEEQKLPEDIRNEIEKAKYPLDFCKKSGYGNDLQELYKDPNDLTDKPIREDVKNAYDAIKQIRKKLDIENPQEVSTFIKRFADINYYYKKNVKEWRHYEEIKKVLELPDAYSLDNMPPDWDSLTVEKENYKDGKGDFEGRAGKLSSFLVACNSLIDIDTNNLLNHKALSIEVVEKAATKDLCNAFDAEWIIFGDTVSIQAELKGADDIKENLDKLLLQKDDFGTYDIEAFNSENPDYGLADLISKLDGYKKIDRSEFYSGYNERIKKLEQHSQNPDAKDYFEKLADFKRNYKSPPEINGLILIEKNRKKIQDVYKKLNTELTDVEEKIYALILTPDKLKEKIDVKKPFIYSFINQKWNTNKDVTDGLSEKVTEYNNLKKLEENIDNFYNNLKIWNDCLKELDENESKCDKVIYAIFKTSYHNRSKTVFNDDRTLKQIQTEFEKFKTKVESVVSVLNDSNSLNEGFKQLKFLDEIVDVHINDYNANLENIKANTFYTDEVKVKEYIDGIYDIVQTLESLDKTFDRNSAYRYISDPNEVEPVVLYYTWSKLSELKPQWPQIGDEEKLEQKARDKIKSMIGDPIVKLAKKQDFEGIGFLRDKQLCVLKIDNEAKELKSQIEQIENSLKDSPNLITLLANMKTALSNLSDGFKDRLEQQPDIVALNSEFSRIHEKLGAVNESVKTIEQFASDLDNKEYDYRLMFSELFSDKKSSIDEFIELISNIEGVKENYKIIPDPREVYSNQATLSAAVGAETDEKKRGDLIEKIKDISDLYTESMKNYHAVYKYKEDVDKDTVTIKSKWEEVQGALKPKFCKYVDFKDGKVVFSEASGLQDKAIPLSDENGDEMLGRDKWDSIKGSNGAMAKYFFENIDDNGSWPKYIKSAVDNTVIFKYVDGTPVAGGPFYMSIKEITIKQFWDFMNKKPVVGDGVWKYELGGKKIFSKDGATSAKTLFKGTAPSITISDDSDEYPVVYVTYDGAKLFCEYLGGDFDLPTKSQYDYVADGINWTEGNLVTHFHLIGTQWKETYEKNKGNTLDKHVILRLHDVEEKETELESKPNDLFEFKNESNDDYWHSKAEISYKGFYDVIGNVWEWCKTDAEAGGKYIYGYSCMTRRSDVLNKDKIAKQTSLKAHHHIGFRVVLIPESVP